MPINHLGTKEIKTERLILRKFQENDDKEIFETWLSDPEVAQYMVWNYHKDINKTKKWLQKCISKYRNLDIYNWGIQLKDNEKLIGSISANRFENNDEIYEIGYAFGKKYWRNGYATESLKAVLDFLIKEIGIKKFLCRYATENQVSGSVIRKIGFKYIGKGEFTSLDGKKIFQSEEYYLDV